jgi:hypothetical protein
MEDRQAWIAAEAAQIAEKLGYPLPKIVFREDKLMGLAMSMYIATSEFTGGLNTRQLPQPELRISPSYLEEKSEGELRYRLAGALIAGDPNRRKSEKRRRDIGAWILAFICLGIGAAGWFLTSSVPVTGSVFFVSLIAGSVLMTKRILKDRTELPLKAIELTGEAEAALALMQGNRDSSIPWIPSFLKKRWRAKGEQRLAKLTMEVRERRLLPGAENDDTGAARR